MEDDPRIVELRSLGATIGTSVYFGPSVYIEKDFAELLTIGDGVVLAHGTTVLLHDSSLNNVTGFPLKFGTVEIGANTYVGANTTIMCGVRIGRDALVGACSLVSRDLPDGCVAFGQPARPVRTVAETERRQRAAAAADPDVVLVEAEPWRERSEASYGDFNDRVHRALAAFLADRGRPPHDEQTRSDP